MARMQLAAQKAAITGLTPVYGAANVDGHSFDIAAGRVLVVKTVGTATTLTFPTPITYDGLALADLTVTVPTNAERHIAVGKFGESFKQQADGNKAYVDFSSVAAVTVALIQA